jgi:hypothetical protein
MSNECVGSEDLGTRELLNVAEVRFEPLRYQPGQPGGARIWFVDVVATREPRGMRPLVAHCHLGLGKLCHRTDKREQAEKHFAAAMTMYREMGMTYWLERAEAAEL